MTISALAPWFGGNRLLASHIGEALEGCNWVGIPFAGGMSELPHITARTMLVNDLHRHVINLARVVADDKLRPILVKRLYHKTLHPDELKAAQDGCLDVDDCFDGGPHEVASFPSGPDLDAAIHYFVSCWMGRSGLAGNKDEFHGRPAIRWNASGGDSAVRYYGAVRMLAKFSRTLRRCTFETLDCFEFLAKCQDKAGHGIYADPPFPDAGRRYRHNAGQDNASERKWHTKLRDALERFKEARVVIRFYEHPLIRELYDPARWEYRALKGGKKQSNDEAPELLIVSRARMAEHVSLFDCIPEASDP